eukprot:GHVS01064162.1.p1 GENE.GHVS01064162.1~~GHVS01064162.1.p1  ORF type:complete len:511 (+),score=69.01 GHVS01064162.1:38-1534(+)
MENTTISSIAWVPRGAAARHPQAANLEQADPKELRKKAHGLSLLADAADVVADQPKEDQDLQELRSKVTKQKVKDGDEVMRWMEETKEDEQGDPGEQFFQVLASDASAVAADPYLANANHDSDDEEATEILPSDFLLLAASSEPDMSSIEVYVFDGENGSLYVHHDIVVGSYPLCLEWLSSSDGGGPGNLVAMGTFSHAIDIWNLDIMDELEPVITLGSSDEIREGTNKTAARGHNGAVMCMHRNEPRRYVLASGSSDETVKLWDINAEKCVHTFTHHSDKVQSVQWHPKEESMLLTGSFDKSVCLCDSRAQSVQLSCPVPSDVESIVWDTHNSGRCMVSTEDGHVVCFDIRALSTTSSQRSSNGCSSSAVQGSSSSRQGVGGNKKERSTRSHGKATDGVLWSFRASKKATTGISTGSHPNLLVTCSSDKCAAVWNTSNFDEKGCPTLVRRKDLQAGPLYACQRNLEDSNLFGFGGNCVVLWDLESDEMICKTFGFSS